MSHTNIDFLFFITMPWRRFHTLYYHLAEFRSIGQTRKNDREMSFSWPVVRTKTVVEPQLSSVDGSVAKKIESHGGFVHVADVGQFKLTFLPVLYYEKLKIAHLFLEIFWKFLRNLGALSQTENF